jgi:hypothetical protein
MPIEKRGESSVPRECGLQAPSRQCVEWARDSVATGSLVTNAVEWTVCP